MIALPVAIGFRVLSLFGVREALAKKLAPLAAIVLGLLLIALAVVAFNFWLDGQRQAAVSADRAQSSAEAVSRARQADEAAQRARAGKSEEIEHANDRARDVAAGSDDPLGDGLRSLRP